MGLGYITTGASMGNFMWQHKLDMVVVVVVVVGILPAAGLNQHPDELFS